MSKARARALPSVPAGMLETIADHLVQYDREWRYVFLTEKGAAMLGKTPDELLGRCIWEVFPEAVGNLFHQILHEAAATGEVRRFEHYYEPFGRWFENHIYPGPDGVVVFATDITQRKATELAVRDVEARHHALLDLLPVGVYWSDAQGILQFYNKRAAQLWGREPKLGTDDARYCGSLGIYDLEGRHIPHDQCPFAEVLRTGQPVSGKEAVLERPDGSRIVASVDISPIRDDAGRLVGAINVFQDATERKRAEAEAQRSRQELTDFIENAAEGLHWVDERGVIVWANRAELEMLGYTAEEYIGRSIVDFHADRTTIEDILRRLKGREILREYQATLRCKDGSLKRVSINSSALFDGDRFVHTRCFTRDITEQQRAAQAQAQLAAIVNSSHDAIIGKTLQGVITSWNAAAERLFGYTAAEMVGQSIERIYPPDRVAEEAQLLARIRVGESVENFETVRRHRDGRLLEISVTISPVRDAAGVIVGASSVAHDIRARKAAERALRHSESRYRSLVGASGAIVFLSDHESRWNEPNADWETYTGQPFAKHRGHGWLEAIHPEDRERIATSVARAHETGTPWQDNARIWHAPSGTWRWQEARAVPIRGPDGTVGEWVGTVLDVHQRREAEQAVQEADRRKDEFLAVLAHELRNPLAPIVSGLQILRLPGSEAMRPGALDIMERQIHHMVRLVDDLLEVSRITRGTIELRREVLSVQDVVRAAVEINRQIIDAHGHALSIELPEAPLPVFGDRVRLTQIVANLLNNAAKYTPRGGRIRVTARAEGGKAVIGVADNGLGIPPHMQERIFEMFAQADRSTERLTGGLGIGLSLSRRLAELHGGTVEVASAGEGRGSEFSVRIPLTAAASAAQTREGQQLLRAAPVQASRILVVDDNKDAARLLATLLQTLGHEVRVSHDGSEALTTAATSPPDVMLLDIGMPAMDGYEVARRVRAQPWGAGIRLVAVTGWGQEADRHRSRQAGFDAHLVKPVDLRQLQTAIQ